MKNSPSMFSITTARTPHIKIQISCFPCFDPQSSQSTGDAPAVALETLSHPRIIMVATIPTVNQSMRCPTDCERLISVQERGRWIRGCVLLFPLAKWIQLEIAPSSSWQWVLPNRPQNRHFQHIHSKQCADFLSARKP